MSRPLYLDTARLGLPSQEVLRAIAALGTFAAREGLSPRFDDLLRGGHASLSAGQRRLYRGLSTWQGVAVLRTTLAQLIGARPGAATLLAGRTTQLMRLASDLLAARCTRVLVTDLEWPGFVRILSESLKGRGRSMISVPIATHAFERGSTSRELARSLATSYRDFGCDGLFLSAVGHLGVRLPVSEVLAELGSRDEPRFIVIDGSQAIGHLPSPLAELPADCFIAGSHKWLGAYRPLGIAVVGGRGAARAREEQFAGGDLGGSIDDPLLRYLTASANDSAEPFSETVDLGALFSAGAACAAASRRGSQQDRLAVLRENADQVADASRGTGWRPLRPDDALRSGILLLQAETDERAASPAAIRRRFLEQGVVLTSYEGGLVRLSMSEGIRRRDVDRLRRALRRVNPHTGRVVVGWSEERELAGVPEFGLVDSQASPSVYSVQRGGHDNRSSYRFIGQEHRRDRPVGTGEDVEAGIGTG